MIEKDGPGVLDVYKKGLDARIATFQTEVPPWEEWWTGHHHHSCFVYEADGEVKGWSALSPVSKRDVYRGVCELSIYVDPEYSHKGIGTKLLEKTIESSEQEGIWTLFSSVFPENIPSLKLHERFGFRVIGRREKIAQLDGVWKDTIILERRSTVIS
ncbi:GNAT family N-acetyltransferase [Spirochaeta cellobiosiphila]|uniref:GNAT family N-acetyltransferase n=1 Tax=Spirochaeta cellobiosiphila TaxID=504483 RepID=UPI0003FEDFEC|nr:GNAT family N-acetyltransferase [Spirochaeta cellobiosiphila]